MLEITLSQVAWEVKDLDDRFRVITFEQRSMVVPANLGMLPPPSRAAIEALLNAQPPLVVIHVPVERLTAVRMGKQLMGDGDEPAPSSLSQIIRPPGS